MPIQFHKPNHGRINANYVEHGKQANGTILHRKQKVSVLDVLQISPSYFYIVNILWALNTSKKLENYLNDTKAYFSRQFAQNYLTTYRQKAFARFKGSQMLSKQFNIGYNFHYGWLQAPKICEYWCNNQFELINKRKIYAINHMHGRFNVNQYMHHGRSRDTCHMPILSNNALIIGWSFVEFRIR